MKNRVNTYLAMAITTYCNKQCFYCREYGESISHERETINFSKLKQIIGNAYDVGIKNFRITGGEPTSVSYFGDLIEFIMALSDTKIRINTNGYMILKYIDILAKYKDRLDVVLSVDSISEYLNEVHFPKFFSENVVNITRELKENGISVRYNIVVTSLNECEVKELIIKSIDEMQVNVKLLDLNKFENYLGYSSKVVGEEAFALWQELFVPMQNFYDFLEEISSDYKSKWTTGFISNGNGIPMSSYFRGKNWIQVKDSTRETKYSDFCKRECSYFKAGNCQEGVFSLFLSSNLMLHLSGCKNSSLQFDLSNYNDNQIKGAFVNLLEFI
jgi:uncharacterized Fe-S cluster-containing radical SAM superfamily protein